VIGEMLKKTNAQYFHAKETKASTSARDHPHPC
jgi:hypothetical protein